MTVPHATSGLKAFTDYFVKNYPGPDTIIGDPYWHAPKLYKAAIYAYTYGGVMAPDALDQPAGSDVATTMTFFRKAYPEPQSKNLHTQLGCHFEEIAEMLDELHSGDHVTRVLIQQATIDLERLSKRLKEHDNLVTFPDRTRMLDALCDQVVTACGVAHMSRMDMVGGYSEINRSNNSKFDDNQNPILDINKKMIKGPNYQKPNLTPFV